MISTPTPSAASQIDRYARPLTCTLHLAVVRPAEEWKDRLPLGSLLLSPCFSYLKPDRTGK